MVRAAIGADTGFYNFTVNPVAFQNRRSQAFTFTLAAAGKGFLIVAL